MLSTDEQRVRQVLNLILLTERCMELPRVTEADRQHWTAELERARRDLASLAAGADLPGDLAAAVARALGSSPAATPVRPMFRGAGRPGRSPMFPLGK